MRYNLAMLCVYREESGREAAVLTNWGEGKQAVFSEKASRATF